MLSEDESKIDSPFRSTVYDGITQTSPIASFLNSFPNRLCTLQMPLSNSEKIRYNRHLILPKFGEKAQLKLKQARVLVVGTGGLGTSMLQYLTAAGVGMIGVLDFDTVDESNLQRQVLFDVNDIGKPKTSTAIHKLKAQNPYTKFENHQVKLDSSNALGIIRQYDVVADGTDNFPTRYLINDACVLLGKPYVYASIHRYEGQVSVFNHGANGEAGPNYRDLFPIPPPPSVIPSCAEGGVLAALPGIIGSMQALEVIKVATGTGEPLSGRLFLMDALDFSTRVIKVRKDSSNPISGKNPTSKELIDYEEFCGMKEGNLASIGVLELKEMLESGESITLIDVREPSEYEISNLGGTLIPSGELTEHLDLIPRQGNVILHCKSGGRSSKATRLLQNKLGYVNLLNLDGGILAWKEAFDPNMEVA